MNIFNITTKTLILDYCINILFDKVSKNFSTFDLFDGCREFKQIIVYSQDGVYYTVAINGRIEQLMTRHTGIHRMIVVSSDFYGEVRNRFIHFSSVKTCIPGELLAVIR